MELSWSLTNRADVDFTVLFMWLRFAYLNNVDGVCVIIAWVDFVNNDFDLLLKQNTVKRQLDSVQGLTQEGGVGPWVRV